ncbi:MAG: ATP-binding protein, partial [Bacteroidales bacterium]
MPKVIQGKKTSRRIKYRTKSEFLANISHEIRSPLGAIVGFAEQLLKTELTAKAKEYAGVIEKSSELLLAFMNDLLILSRIEAGRIDFEEEHFKISNVIDYIHKTMKVKAQHKKIGFSVHTDEVLNRVVLGDEFRLSQILFNLVSNAIKFTNKGKVELNCKYQSETHTKVFVEITVTDTGVGIEPDKFDVIFEQFRQADSSITQKFGGTGLGLTITKRLVEMQDGKIEVKSLPGKGTTFKVLLPFMKSEENVQLDDYERAHILFNGKKVLIVDDDGVNRLLGETILAGLGFEVDLAAGGMEAMDKLSDNRYDIVVLDVKMPDITGLEVARFIREKQKDTETRILAVTAAFLKEDILSYKVAGIDDYLVKPFRENKLYARVCKLLGYDAPSVKKKEQKTEAAESTSGTLIYDLSELKAITRNEPGFLVSMLDTFLHNMKNGMKKIRQHTDQKNWTLLGETAHKLIPSFKH